MPNFTRSLVLSVVATACQASSPSQEPSVTGRWASACLPQQQADGSTLYATIGLVGTAPDQWALDYTLHGDPGCAGKLVTISIAGSYDVAEPSPSVAGAWNARFGFEDKTITPFVQPIADALAANHCGTGAAWQLGVAQSVYDTGCAAFGQYPRSQCDADFDLLSIAGPTLHFGNRPADNNMCSPDRRPTQLASFELTRQGS